MRVKCSQRLIKKLFKYSAEIVLGIDYISEAKNKWTLFLAWYPLLFSKRRFIKFILFANRTVQSVGFLVFKSNPVLCDRKLSVESCGWPLANLHRLQPVLPALWIGLPRHTPSHQLPHLGFVLTHLRLILPRIRLMLPHLRHVLARLRRKSVNWTSQEIFKTGINPVSPQNPRQVFWGDSIHLITLQNSFISESTIFIQGWYLKQVYEWKHRLKPKIDDLMGFYRLNKEWHVR